MKKTWHIDADTAVLFQTHALGRRTISVNGKEIERWRCFGRDDVVPFVVPDTLKKARLTVRVDFPSQVVTELRVDGRLMIQAEDLVPCPKCGATPKAYDTFCERCGSGLAPPEDYEHIRQLKWARNSIKYLGILYLVFGLIMFLVTKKPMLMLVNFMLAAVMGILFLWSKRAPLAAIVVASATYLVVQVTNGLIDPRTLAQGIYLKIVIVAVLAKGVKSALALRERNA